MQKYDISLNKLPSGSRRRDVAQGCDAKSWIAVRELGHSGADVARYFEMTNSFVIRFVASGQQLDIDDLIRRA